MDEKISLEAIALYGDAYAEKVLKTFFSSRDQIMGKEILSLSNVQQVNMFVIREIFRSWKDETRKQKSIYFDNEHPEVKEALQNYMAIVSNHILVDQTHFAPILKKAVSHSLLAIFNPYDFFSMIITGKNNKLDVAAFREDLKYLKVNKAPLERMLEKLDEQGTTELAGNEAFAILDHILEEVNFTPEDVEPYIQRFSEVVPLNAEKFYIPNHTTSPAKPIEKREKTVEVTDDTSVNTRQNTHRETAVMDNLTRISKIKESLSINQKFMFTKVLFYGDFDSFSRAIDEIDQLNDLSSALNYLEGHSATWDRDSKEFHEFMELVEKRFS